MIHDVEHDLGAQWSKRLAVGLLDWKITLAFCISHIFNLVQDPKIYENGRSQILILCGRLGRTYVKAFHLKKLTLLEMLTKY